LEEPELPEPEEPLSEDEDEEDESEDDEELSPLLLDEVSEELEDELDAPDEELRLSLR
jgi:hypothetical protein